MARDLKDKVIVIVGASSGIGAATAIACAQAGMHTVLAARRQDRLGQVADQVRQLGRRAMAVACNVDSDQDVTQLFNRAVAEFGRLDAVFANAGYGLMVPVADTSDRTMRDIFETNFFGTMRCIHAALPLLRKNTNPTDKGHIIICSSCVSELSPPLHGAYSATKAAQDAIAQSLRAELADEGIYVSSVHPITTSSEFFDRVAEHAPPDHADPFSKHLVVQTTAYVAKTIVRCLRKPRPEVWPHVPTRIGMAICTAIPSVTAYAMRKMMRSYQRQQSRHTTAQV